ELHRDDVMPWVKPEPRARRRDRVLVDDPSPLRARAFVGETRRAGRVLEPHVDDLRAQGGQIAPDLRALVGIDLLASFGQVLLVRRDRLAIALELERAEPDVAER